VLELARGIASATDRLESFGAPHAGADSEADSETDALFADGRIDAGVAGESRRTEPSPTKLLWVDDEPDNNRWERRALESYGLRFTLAKDTETAKTLLSGSERFAAVISDMGRPGDSRAGITLLEWLRGGPNAAMPYFIYTSRRAAKRKPSAHAPVPLGITADPDELVEMVVSAVR
jgi:CheY-like chemotaxis protein